MAVAELLLPFVGINFATIAAFATDKQRAVKGEWRISESTLLGLAMVGGSPGALWARQRFRHKTRKQPFCAILEIIVMAQAGIVLGLAIAFMT